MRRLFNKLPIFFFVTSYLFSEDITFPKEIDFNAANIRVENSRIFANAAWRLGFHAFNRAPELTPFFAKLQQKYQITTAVETGTNRGDTSVALSYLFEDVHTIEILPQVYELAKHNLNQFKNVTCHLGSSEKILASLLPSLQGKRTLFYLDAHWDQFWPLLDELEEIGKTHKDNCIIVIDDFKIPWRTDIPYDAYEDHECSYHYIQNQLDKVFSSYYIHYLIPLTLESRAKFIAIPQKWASPY